MRKPTDPPLLKCRHFNGVQNQACKAGVPYATIRAKGEYPCLGYHEEGEAKCDKCSYITLEEWQERRQKAKQSIAYVVFILQKISQIEGGSGTVQCPKCNGTVRWSRAAYNGHVHAQCQTQDCIKVMQ